MPDGARPRAADDFEVIREALERIRREEHNPTTAVADLYCTGCRAPVKAGIEGPKTPRRRTIVGPVKGRLLRAPPRGYHSSNRRYGAVRMAARSAVALRGLNGALTHEPLLAIFHRGEFGRRSVVAFRATPDLAFVAKGDCTAFS